MTRRVARVLLVLGAIPNGIGCIITPPYFKTRTEVVTSADSMAVFGDRFSIRLMKQEVSVQWNQDSRWYSASEEALGYEALRVARLKGELYLLQVTTSEQEFVLVPVRISKTREMNPLSCQPSQHAAADYGVRMRPDDDGLSVELSGDRPGIIGSLAALVDTCKPLLQLDALQVPVTELARAGAPPGRSYAQCIPCPAGQAACIQGAVVDHTGAVLPDVVVTAVPEDPSGKATTTHASESGEFFMKGVREGNHRLRLSFTGFSSVDSPAFYVRPGFTYVFESPIEMMVTTVEGSVADSQEPLECRGSRRRSPQ